jgi:hypothetical protein
MEKTLEIQLAEQRDRIYTAILDAASPEPATWEHKLLFEQARIVFAKAVLEAGDAIL